MDGSNRIKGTSGLIKRIILLLSWLGVAAIQAASPVDLEQGFLDPPASARPHTWWHWMNGNITKEGLTADLEAMKRIGLGGAQIFNVSESIPDGPVRFMSPQWRDLIKHTVQEADRLGLELCIHNCAGWSSSGGPWITPEYAMQQVVYTETSVSAKAHQNISVTLKQPQTNRGFYRDIAVLAFPTPRDDSKRIADIRPKAGFESRYGQQPDLRSFPRDAIVSEALDLTDKLGQDGRLTWDVPAEANWTILRMGYTPTGAQNAPSPESGRGLECDKLSRTAMDVHWAGMMGPLIQDLGPLAGKTLNNSLIDSYEVGHQNWTPRFREEFQKRRGYDPIRLLPVLTGRVVGSGETSERFLWDFRRTIADLFADNYYSYFSDLCHKNGLQASIEPYDGPFECLLSGRDADIPMGEFWVGGGESSSCKLAASVAHTYGRRLVGAESFTATPDRGRWQNYPYSLKAVGDLMYCTGINRYIIHRYAHQPWLDRFPGMTMGQWGTHFERTTTWWDQGEAWVRYLTRCQFLLQQGLFAADVCFLASETAPNNAPYVPDLKAKGHDYDACNADVLLRRMSVKDGRLILPDGMSYRVLVLPETPFMTARLLTRVRDLIEQGAVVIGPRPVQSPSLSEGPEGDALVKRLGAEVWADCDGKTVQSHVFGKGRVFDRPVDEVLAGLNVKPDCEFAGTQGRPKMAWIHRVVDGADVYFVSNQRPMAQEVQCTFRVTGRQPEFWHPDTSRIEVAPVWSEKDGRTTVSIPFDPAGSVFVVFRKPVTSQDHLVAVKWPSAESAGTTGPRIAIRRARYEAVDGAGGADVTVKVVALVKAGETDIPATNDIFGDPIVNHVKRLHVDYTVDGKTFTQTADEGVVLTLGGGGGSMVWPAGQVVISSQGRSELRAFRPGIYEFQTAQGKALKTEVKSVAESLEVVGSWTLRFPAKWGAPPQVTLDRLISWTEHSDPGVRYFSGTAEYQKEFEVPAELLKQDRAMVLDLGQVKNLAEVTFNGQDLGVWWKPPFAADVTGLVRSGKNSLKVRVTNLWINRLIGDEQVSDDCQWNGKPLKGWPQWFLEGTPRPAKERLTFTTWKHWTRDSSLVESGLLGPVRLRPAVVVGLD